MNLKDVHRFWNKVDMREGCWPWKGALFSGTERGQFKINKKTVKAYRFSYEIIKGDIPKGLTIDHLCRNPICVNPWHLEAVTQNENRARVPRASVCSRGHDRVPGTRRCKICSVYFQPNRAPEKRRAQYLKNKAEKIA